MKELNVAVEEKLYPIAVNGKYGFIDKTGKVVTEPKFDGVESFSGGLARVYDDNAGFGYIDKTGKYVWEPTK